MKVLRWVGINLAVFVALVGAVEIFAAIFLEAGRIKRIRSESQTDPRAFLPNYDTIDWAVPYFQEERRPQSAQYKSYIGFKMKPFQGKYINIDTSGFRITPQERTAKDSLPIAIFLGGSTMYGSGSSDPYTIPAFFAQAQPSHYIQNYAQPAYTAYQSFVLLQLETNKGLKPQTVISYDGVNDSPAFHGYFAHNREVFFQDRIQKIYGSMSTQSSYLLPATRTILRQVKGGNRPQNKARSFTRKQNKMAAEELLRAWLSMKTLCEQINARFICILQPNAFVGSPDLSHLEIAKNQFMNQQMAASYEYYQEVRRLMETAPYEGLKAHFLDFSTALDQHPGVYIDYCHLSPNGNQIIAGEILKYFQPSQHN